MTAIRRMIWATTALLLVGGLTGAVRATASTAPAAPPVFHHGARDLGDPLVPGLGNGGYDVGHYGIVLAYQPDTGLLTGTTTITARLTENLDRFDLDFALPTTSVMVNGAAATFATSGNGPYNYARELMVTPAQGLLAGSTMTVVVRYSAHPGEVLISGLSDWTETSTGVQAWDEPIAAVQWWFPSNAYPSDKATYDVTVTAPKAYTAVTNGRLLSRTVTGAQATAYWRGDDPMATYVAVLAIGRYDVVRGQVLGSIPSYVAYESGAGALRQRAEHDIARTPEVLSFLQSQWGPYPFTAAGALVVGYPYASALETQTRPTYEYGLWQNVTDNLWAVLHENSHMWFGDSVTMTTWSNIWLAEGFATYSEWLWSQHEGNGTAEQLFLATYHQRPAGDPFWATPLNQPGFAPEIEDYDRGAMLLQALRNRVGSATFFTIMRTWVAQHRHGNASSEQFAALATTVSGQDLTSFFQAWLSGDTRPAATVANGFPPGAQAALATGQVPVPASAAAIERSDAILARSGS